MTVFCFLLSASALSLPRPAASPSPCRTSPTHSRPGSAASTRHVEQARSLFFSCVWSGADHSSFESSGAAFASSSVLCGGLLPSSRHCELFAQLTPRISRLILNFRFVLPVAMTSPALPTSPYKTHQPTSNSPSSPLIHSFFHDPTSTFQFLIVDPKTKSALVVDPALDYDPASGSSALCTPS